MIFLDAYLDRRLLYVRKMLRSGMLLMTSVVDLVFDWLSAAKKFSINIDMLELMISSGIISLYEFGIGKKLSC